MECQLNLISRRLPQLRLRVLKLEMVLPLPLIFQPLRSISLLTQQLELQEQQPQVLLTTQHQMRISVQRAF